MLAAVGGRPVFSIGTPMLVSPAPCSLFPLADKVGLRVEKDPACARAP